MKTTAYTTAPFSLTKALAGHPLITRGGRAVKGFRRREKSGFDGLHPDVSEYPYCVQIAGIGWRSFQEDGYFRGTHENNYDLFLKVAIPAKQAAPKRSHKKKPAHYTSGKIECIDAIREALGLEGFKAFCRGNVLQYTWRADKKGNPAQDMAKAEWYAAKVKEAQ